MFIACVTFHAHVSCCLFKDAAASFGYSVYFINSFKMYLWKEMLAGLLLNLFIQWQEHFYWMIETLD